MMGKGTAAARGPAPGRRALSETLVWTLLLLGSLGVAYRTYTQATVGPVEAGPATLWEEPPASLRAVTYESGNAFVGLERRDDGVGTYVWGTVVRRQPAGDGSGDPGTEPADTTYFIAGSTGERLWEMLASPVAVREVGPIPPERRASYGLVDPYARLAFRFENGSRELLLGDEVVGRGDRYALDPSSGRVYVVERQLVMLLNGAEDQLPERRLHAYAGASVARATVRAGGHERTMLRSSTATGDAVWSSPETPDVPDQAFGNFMARANSLWPTQYVPGVDWSTVAAVMAIEFVDSAGNAIGFLEVGRREAPGGGHEYLFRTEHLRVPARTYESLIENLVLDVEQVF